uniref:CBM21 domain-containing protein n=1 Tax=Takifugu rubripes TaxID=31033 RepID=A0A674MZQ8_TAKRU
KRGNHLTEPIEMPVVDERPRGRETFLKPPQSPNLRRRCKSLPTPTERAKLEISRTRSPTSQKKVRFADSLGLELITIKHFDDTEEPEVPERILAKLSNGPLHLNTMDTKFPRAPAVREVKVLLESVETDEFSLSGIVRVLNLAFEKSVFLRYSLNNWITFMDSLASYVPCSSDGVTDRFRFKIVTPTYLDSGGTLQFAIRYCVGGVEFWDNNNGNNYKPVRFCSVVWQKKKKILHILSPNGVRLSVGTRSVPFAGAWRDAVGHIALMSGLRAARCPLGGHVRVM